MAGSGSLQHFIPLSIAEVKQRLFSRSETTDSPSAQTPDSNEAVKATDEAGLAQVCELIEALFHHRLHDRLKRLKAAYEKLDPAAEEHDLTEADGFMSLFGSLLEDGNWQPISEQELEDALEGEDVFPISLNVPFEEFTDMRIYKLGERMVIDQPKPNLIQKILKKTPEQRSISVYDRVILAIQFQPKSWFEENGIAKRHPGNQADGVHLRLFSTIPKLDLEVIYPNTTPKMKAADKVKIIAPLIGGLVSLIMKFGPVLAGAGQTGDTSISLLGGILAALGSYMLKTYLKYRKTKEEYLIAVSQNLFFKGQANDQAVIMSILDLAEAQEVKEALLAYTFLSRETAANHTQTTLDKRIEAWLSSQGVEVDFEVDDALDKLLDMGLLERQKLSEDGETAWDGEEWVDAESDPIGTTEHIGVVSLKEALVRLDKIWDDLYQFNI